MKSRLYKVFRFSDVCLFLGRAPYPFFSFNFMFIILVLLLIIDYFFFFQFHVYFTSIFFFFSDCAFHGERAAISFLFRPDIQALAPFSSEDNFSDMFFSVVLSAFVTSFVVPSSTQREGKRELPYPFYSDLTSRAAPDPFPSFTSERGRGKGGLKRKEIQKNQDTKHKA